GSEEVVQDAPLENNELNAEIDLQKTIQEEYKLWKQNVPFLYDLVITHALEWPSLTIQWLPDKKTIPGTDYSIQRLILGTHTSGNDQNYLQIASVQLPNFDEDTTEFTPSTIRRAQATGSYTIEISQKIPHDGDVNRARYMPQKPEIIATMGEGGNAYIFDTTCHDALTTGEALPQAVLKGHTAEGFGLCWNPNLPGNLATGAEDQVICLWDVQTQSFTSSETKVISPIAKYHRHTDIVNDVQFHPQHEALLASVSDDCTLQIHDTRLNPEEEAPKVIQAHSKAINAVAINPFNDYLLATASADKTVALWDLRNPYQRLHTLEGHEDEVYGLEWSPHDEPILASSSTDRRVCIWDLEKIGEEQTPEDAEDGSPELLFMHGGHTNRISEFSWCPNERWVVGSLADDNILQIWSPSRVIWGRDHVQVSPRDLE
uniref:Histone acetyltransferase type B subunit 2 n=1 Tax=Schizosaccharomyces pombe TaxID=4896 RepID=UPI00119C903B|nr:Chain A, Histone acetyltransferase type B subunit 2 [Schizosaccharomyces pombe]6S1R_A Chain A, Histone acetyltransferase type B subunit 2 [Schizosaccharomyces pombe]6S29_A Chain A, Histone acetyltransferase type B subunit 2 [Schizosaccharomyces pombe]6S29_C Chain C, Histone acetyltransferase type B subunit 2 [Schizosaccharomyces pombe]